MKLFTMFLLVTCANTASAQTLVDGIDLTRASFYGSPDVSHWEKTVPLITVQFQPGATFGVSPVFNRNIMNARWPDIVPPGWEGAIQSTIWACISNNGRDRANVPDGWHCAGLLEFWGDRNGPPRVWTGAPWLELGIHGGINWSENWVYRDLYGPMHAYVPQFGDEVAFFLTAGDVRWPHDLRTVQERTNVVRVKLMSDGTATPLPADNVPPTPPPTDLPPTPPPPTTPTPPPVSDIDRLYQALAGLRTYIEHVVNEQSDAFVKLTSAVDSLTGRVNGLAQRVTDLEARPYQFTCRASWFGIGLSCSVIPSQ